MPCMSDHMEPSARELHQKEASQLLVYVGKELKQPVKDIYKFAAKDVYGAGGTYAIVELCSVISTMSDLDIERIVYNGHDPMARRLADWWDEHKREDEKQIKNKKEAALKKRATAAAKIAYNKIMNEK